MSFSGLDVFSGFYGAPGGYSSSSGVISFPKWSENLADGATTTNKAPATTRHELGESLLWWHAATPGWVSVGSSPDASSAGTRVFENADTKNCLTAIIATPGDRVSFAAGALSGLHVIQVHRGGGAAANLDLTDVIRKMVWSETLSTPGMTVKSALRSKHGAGEASFHLQSSDDKFVAVGPNPDATNGPRYIVPVEFAVDICADHGDHVAYVNASAFTGVHVTYCFAGGLSWQGNTSSELANAMWSETLTVAGQTSNIAKEAPRRDVHGDGLFWVFATVDGYITLIQAADPTSVARIPIRARHFEAVSAQPGDRLAWLPA